ncbi:hypothetical protein SUGI_1489450 [Cryptomeria japonica]|uniref:Uncharacterized protein n=1 Tax=Cryptomeria japonica TaxID=3369 RepID=A0AAD3NUA7_CRYJA|nr:hypothetical protein SUGI_1489450 [Cryptomeria japonica]
MPKRKASIAICLQTHLHVVSPQPQMPTACPVLTTLLYSSSCISSVLSPSPPSTECQTFQPCMHQPKRASFHVKEIIGTIGKITNALDNSSLKGRN